VKRWFLVVCSVLAVLVVAIGLLMPGCTGQGAGKGSIVVQATLCGIAWQGQVNYTLSLAGAGSPISGTVVPTSHSNVDVGTWTCAYVSGGPPGAFLKSIKPSATQSLVANGTVTFTLDFELNQDAAIQWSTWTLNGAPWQSPTLETVPCNILDVHFLQSVDGCTGYNVTLNETDWLTITAAPANPAPVCFYVVNHDCALNKTPSGQGLPPVKKSQEATVNNITRPVGYNVTVNPGASTGLDVHTQWQLVKGINYTKSINWLGISKAPYEPELPPHPCVLFELVVPMPGQYVFTLVTSAHVDLVGDTDVNLANNDAVSIPPLTLIVNVI